jgi:hypothetical protein
MMWQAKMDAPNSLAREAAYGNAFIEASEKSVANKIFFRLATGFGTRDERTVAIGTSLTWNICLEKDLFCDHNHMVVALP